MNQRQLTMLLFVIAVATVMITFVPVPSAITRPLAVSFWLIVPGWAVTAVLLTGPLPLRLCGAVTLSVTFGVLTAQAMAMVGVWMPMAASATAAIASAVALAMELVGQLPVRTGVERQIPSLVSSAQSRTRAAESARPSARLLAFLAFVLGVALGGAIQFVLVLLQ